MPSVTQRRRDGRKVWLAQINVKGFQRLSRQFDDRKAAQEWADEQERALRKLRQTGGASAEVSTLTIGELLERFLRDPKVAQRRYRLELENLLGPWLVRYGGTKVRAFGAVQIIDTRDHLLLGRSGSRVNRYLSAMRSCWHWGQGAGLVDRAAGWPRGIMLQEPRGRVRYLSDEELGALLAAAQKHSPTMHAAVIVSIATGIRQGELLRLTWKDIDFAKSRLTVLESKNGQPRAVHLTATAVTALRDLKRTAIVGAQVFLKLDGQPFDKDALAYHWKLIREAAGLTDFKWHDLRHTCASFLAQNGATLLEIGGALGHRSPNVTLRYSHLVQGAPVTGHAALDSKLRQ